jgi:hypothetical protein
VDLSENNSRRLKKIHNIEVLTKSIFSLSQTDFHKPLNCIILAGVLEHVIDLHSCLEILTDLLADDGLIIISVPFANMFWSHADLPFEEFSMEHVNFFTDEALELLMSLHGYKLKKSTQIEYLQSIALVAAFQLKPKANSEIMWRYVNASVEFLRSAIAIIDGYASSQKPIAIWGTGTFCQYLLANTSLSDCNIKIFVDRNISYHGHTLCGILIQSPNALTASELSETDILTISYHFNDEIEQEIRTMGLQNNIIKLVPRIS